MASKAGKAEQTLEKVDKRTLSMIGFRADKETEESVNEYTTKAGFKVRAEAVRFLVTDGINRFMARVAERPDQDHDPVEPLVSSASRIPHPESRDPDPVPEPLPIADCPFCGGQGLEKVISGATSKLYCFKCDHCNISGPMRQARNDALFLWNRRSMAPAGYLPARASDVEVKEVGERPIVGNPKKDIRSVELPPESMSFSQFAKSRGHEIF